MWNLFLVKNVKDNVHEKPPCTFCLIDLVLVLDFGVWIRFNGINGVGGGWRNKCWHFLFYFILLGGGPHGWLVE